ncbi:MAG: tetratricopeptide repeat protein [Planctomycetota bacterium]
MVITLSEAEALLGDVAVACGFVTPERLRECVDLVEIALPYGVPVSLLDLLRDKGYLTAPQAETVERAAGLLVARKEDRLYGAIAVKHGLVTQAQVDAGLAEQQRRCAGDGPVVRLSELLQEGGLIDARHDLALWSAVEKARREGPPPRVVRRERAQADPSRGGPFVAPPPPVQEPLPPAPAEGTGRFASIGAAVADTPDPLPRQAWEADGGATRAAADDRQALKVLEERAEACRLKGDREGAIASYARVLQEEPDHLVALRRISVLCVDTQNWVQAARHLTSLIRRDAGDLAAHMMLGDAHVRMGQPKQALAVYRAARRIAPAHRELAYRLCELLEGERDHAGVVEALEDLLRFHPDDPDVNRRYRGAKWNSQARRMAELTAALARNTEDPETHLELAGILFERSERPEALAELSEATRCGASSTRMLSILERAVHQDLAWAEGVAALRDAYLRAHVPDRAVSLLESRARDVGGPGAEVELVELLVATGEVDSALERMRALLVRPDAPQDALIAIAGGILDKDRMHARAHRFLSQVYGRRGDFARAAHHLKSYLYVEKKDVEALGELAATLERLNDSPGAAVAWRSYVVERPKDARAWRVLGRILLDIGQVERAREAARKAALLAPSEAASLELLRSVEERVLDVEIERHVAQLKVDPNKTQVRLTLAECYRRRGKMDEARRELERAARDADFTLASRATRLLVEQAAHEPAGVPLLERLRRMEELRGHLRLVTGERPPARSDGAEGATATPPA